MIKVYLNSFSIIKAMLATDSSLHPNTSHILTSQLPMVLPLLPEMPTPSLLTAFSSIRIHPQETGMNIPAFSDNFLSPKLTSSMVHSLETVPSTIYSDKLIHAKGAVNAYSGGWDQQLERLRKEKWLHASNGVIIVMELFLSS